MVACLALMLFVVFLLIFILFNFPWIAKYWRLTAAEYVVRNSYKVAFVSDIHLGAYGCNTRLIKVIGEMLNRLNVSVLVIVGDLIDRKFYLSSKYLERIASLVVEALNLRDIIVLYIPSNSFHDIALVDLNRDILGFKLGSRNVEFIYSSHMLKIVFEGCSENVYVTHGDYISRNGIVSYLLDKISRKVLGKGITGIIMRRIFGLDSESWVILGHSHIPSIDRKYRAIVLGSWVKRFFDPRGYSIAVASCRNNAINIIFKVFR